MNIWNLGHDQIKNWKFCIEQLQMILKKILSNEYTVISLNSVSNQEAKITGGYYDKIVDIAIKLKEKVVGVVGIKFVMQNYAQNANNYFENLLGETINIQLTAIPYFKVLFLQRETPYFKTDGTILKMEKITEKVTKKYLNLYEKTAASNFHIPNLFFFGVIDKNNVDLTKIKTKEEYKTYLLTKKTHFTFKWSKNPGQTKSQIIINDYQEFLNAIKKKIKQAD